MFSHYTGELHCLDDFASILMWPHIKKGHLAVPLKLKFGKLQGGELN